MSFCSYLNCSSSISFLCSCSSPPVLLCNTHCSLHISSSQLAKHTISSAFKPVATEDKSPIVSFLSTQLNQIRLSKSKLISKTKSLLKLIDSLFTSITNYESSIIANLNEVALNSRAQLFNLNEGENTVKVEDLKKNSRILEDLIDGSRIDEEIADIKNTLEFLIKDTDRIGIIERKEDESSIDKVYFTVNESNDFMFYDCSLGSLKKVEVKNLKLSRWGAAICSIGKDQVFLYGGSKCKTYLNDAYLINVKENTFEALPSSLCRRQMSAEYINGKVYVFGGLSGSDISQSVCFDLINKTNSFLSPLPEKIRNTSTLYRDQNILITGIGKSMFLYDIIQDNYKKIDIEFEIPGKNMLTSNGKKMILLVEGKIYAFDNLDFDGLIHKKLNTNFGFITSKPCFMKEKREIYFVDHKGLIFKIDCESLEVRIIIGG